MTMKETLQALLGKEVVIDTRSPWMYIGTLAAVQADSVLLKNVDVHDSGETSTPKERYVIDSSVSGIKANRCSVYINSEYVVSVSLLSEVIQY
jgi:small nuclear ribonucleoprotein (snRNP)-like protein